MLGHAVKQCIVSSTKPAVAHRIRYSAIDLQRAASAAKTLLINHCQHKSIFVGIDAKSDWIALHYCQHRYLPVSDLSVRL